MWINTLPVYSRLAPRQEVPDELASRLPANCQLYSHQLATYQALTSGDADVVFNVAMTGDGKSLAGFLPAVVSRRPTLVMYPTNELIRDQVRQMEGIRQDWQQEHLGFAPLNADELDKLVDSRDLPRRDALASLWHNHEVVLTNPDIFHYVMQQYYLRYSDNPDRVIGQLLRLFDQFTFDEFHVLGTPEAVSVVNALIFIRELCSPDRPKKFLFLSATPNQRLRESLERAGLRCAHIEGAYANSLDSLDPEAWRLILRGARLHFSPAGAEDWVAAHLEDILLPFFQSHRPAAKGAIIVNSVVTAHRLAAQIAPKLEKHGLTVATNTGFDAWERRRKSYEADLLIGTSTIDVGVDFQINFLVFESLDAGTFLQRLGRLGRHEGFSAKGVCHRFQAFEAHALVPPWIQDRLFQPGGVSPPPLAEGMEVDREYLGSVIQEAFPQPAAFPSYGRVWGGLQAARIVSGLNAPTIKDTYAHTRQRLGDLYQKSLHISVRREHHRLKEMWDQERPLVKDVLSFRGGGDLPCGVIDQQEDGPNRVKRYDLFSMLANFHLLPLTEEEFYREVDRWELHRPTYQRAELAAYYRVTGVRQQRNDIWFRYNRAIDGWDPDDFGKARVLSSIEVQASDRTDLDLNHLNHSLSRRHLVALLCLLRRDELSRPLRLPRLFPIYRFESRDNKEGSIAFGRQALLLQVALQDRPDVQCGGFRPMIF